MTRFPIIIGVLLCVALVLGLPRWSAAFKMVHDVSDPHEGPRLLVVPFGFKTEASGSGVGVGATYSGWPQEQAIIGGAAWKTFDRTDAIYLNLTDFQLPFAKRLFLMVHGFDSSYGNMVSYASGGGAADNNSGKHDLYKGHGWDQWLEGELTYVMPWGPFGDELIHTYTTDKGILTKGSLYAGEFDPSVSGRSYFKIKPYYRHRWYRDSVSPNTDIETGGFRFTFEYDNSDFTYDPSEGSTTMLRLYQGIDAGKSDSWTGVELDFSSYWNLGASSWFAKQVVALNFWTVDTPSWNTHADGTVTGNSPYFMGAALGGYTHQRGYPFYRFHDKAAINYAVEYRVMPKWNPLGTFTWFKWWEVVPFAEVGRVAPYWNPRILHQDMKFSAGVGLRAMILNSVLRLDVAGSAEGANVWAMLNQSF
ncbi:hypothetical protein GO013_14995 [Pseudodesulfovibrio sp. JC047]|uniref:hypothetical protein n=1 Tax=Pseudodesulfovibrio sp. JC047 TaxID=2683199 RepID=UPI0013D66CDE|nr:hypothetical protein [Pseudodesulfovibrio sp. JC047]NDV20715.1 hypothetical protein [Pseudodesulfovibrio sp. JC047]